MKISDSTLSSTLLLSSSSLLRASKSKKPFKFNRRLKNRMNTLSKNSLTNKISNNPFHMIPTSSLWTNTQLVQSNPMVTVINTSPSSINTYPQSATPRVTTTLIPLNVCPTECCQLDQLTLVRSVNINVDYHEQKSRSTVTTHLIGDWIIRESSEPFQRKENEEIAPIERMTNLEKTVTVDQPIMPLPLLLPTNVKQWTIDNVCLFFERVLGKTDFAPLIKEHMIDGAALLLLQEEHLIDIFKMQLGPRLKLLNRINNLKHNDPALIL